MKSGNKNSGAKATNDFKLKTVGCSFYLLKTNGMGMQGSVSAVSCLCPFLLFYGGIIYV